MPEASVEAFHLVTVVAVSSLGLQPTLFGVAGGIVSTTTWLTLKVGSPLVLIRLAMTYAQMRLGQLLPLSSQLTVTKTRSRGTASAAGAARVQSPPVRGT